MPPTVVVQDAALLSSESTAVLPLVNDSTARCHVPTDGVVLVIVQPTVLPGRPAMKASLPPTRSICRSPATDGDAPFDAPKLASIPAFVVVLNHSDTAKLVLRGASAVLAATYPLPVPSNVTAGETLPEQIPTTRVAPDPSAPGIVPFATSGSVAPEAGM